MKDHEKAAEWVYRGVWHVLANWFRVPEHPPTLPVHPGELLRTFHPARAFLSYIKLKFWFGAIASNAVLLTAWMVLSVANPLAGAILALPVFFFVIVPALLGYIALHLRYDTTWYVMTDHSLRCRRGIWVILEHTITFENVQNVLVTRGPLQTLFGISDIVVETAGASEGGGSGHGHSRGKSATGNKAIFEGVDNPQEIRELILERIRASKSAGLGDEAEQKHSAGWSAEHVAVLRDIVSLVRP